MIMKGVRTASISSEIIFGHVDEPRIYLFDDDISEYYWVNIRDTEDVDEGILDNNCLTLIEAQEFESAGITQYFYCTVHIAGETAPLRVGPGVTRGVRMIAIQNDRFEGIGKAVVNDELWYQVKTTNGNLWVLAEDTDSGIASRNQYVAADCRDLPTIESPPIIQSESQNSNLSSSQNCTTFTILRPIATVSDGDSTYMWSSVDEADKYILNFSDYLGNYVTSINVDGAENSIVINTGSLATGSELSFEVVAMANGEPLCRTYRMLSPNRHVTAFERKWNKN